MGLKPGSMVELLIGGPVMVVAVSDESWHPDVLVYYFDHTGVLHDKLVHGFLLREIGAQGDAPDSFGIPEALQKAKDDVAAKAKAELEKQWNEDQIRYAHTTGYDFRVGVDEADHG